MPVAAPLPSAEPADPGAVVLSSAEALLSAVALVADSPGRVVVLQLPIVTSALAAGGSVQVCYSAGIATTGQGKEKADSPLSYSSAGFKALGVKLVGAMHRRSMQIW